MLKHNRKEEQLRSKLYTLSQLSGDEMLCEGEVRRCVRCLSVSM